LTVNDGIVNGRVFEIFAIMLLKRTTHLHQIILCNCFIKSTSIRFTSNDIHFGQAQERARSVSAYYNQSSIDAAAKKNSVRLVPTTMLYTGRNTDRSNVIRSAQYLHMELPVRIAHRIDGFRGLPFIVGCNPSILQVHEMYIRAFHILQEFPQIIDFETENRFSKMIQELLDDHSDVVTLLAEGFKESRRHIKFEHFLWDESLIKSFLDRTLTSRLGMRMLCEHHLGLHEEKANYVGIICVNFSPKNLIEKKAEVVSHMSEAKYGQAPEVRVNGHLGAKFPYIPQPVDYVIHEILKNSMRAHIEAHATNFERMPPIMVTIANNDTDFVLRITDRGGGIAHDDMDRIWEYGYTTGGADEETKLDRGIFGQFMENRSAGAMHGYGFGLPACKAYIQYLGGSLDIYSMQGIGTDVYIRLRHIDGKQESFRI